jgi:hypothetical protein
MGSYICLSYFHPFQMFFIHIDKFYLFLILFSSNLPTLYNVKKIVWPIVYAVFSVVSQCTFSIEVACCLEDGKNKSLIGDLYKLQDS